MPSVADLKMVPNGESLRTDRATVPAPQRRWKTRVLLPGAILLLAAGMLGYAARDALLPAKDVRVVPVVVRSVADGGGAGGSVVVQAPGWVESDPYSVSVPALTDGIVKEVLVLEGDVVKAGQTVVKLVDEDARLALGRAEAELAEAEADYATSEAALKAAQREWDNPVERKRAVESGEAMVAEAKAELAQLESQVAAEVAKAEELREELARRAKAFEGRAASEFEVIQTRLRLRAQEALVESTKAKRPMLQAKVDRVAAELAAALGNFRLRIAETAALEGARSSLSKSKAAVERARAMRDEAKLRLERMEVRSPAGGVVMARFVSPGTRMMLSSDMPNSAVAVRLYDPKKLQVRVDIPLADAAKVGVGQRAQIVVDVLPDRVFQGKVTRAVHEADVAKNTQQFKVAIDDPAAELKPEMLARVKFLSAERKGSSGPDINQRVFAPEKALMREGSQTHAWIVDQGKNVAVMKTVKVGTSAMDGWVEVLEGLMPGDRVIVDHNGLRDGQKVEVIGEAPM